MNWEYILLAACIILVVLPPRYDPAIRLKMWTMGWKWGDWKRKE